MVRYMGTIKPIREVEASKEVKIGLAHTGFLDILKDKLSDPVKVKAIDDLLSTAASKEEKAYADSNKAFATLGGNLWEARKLFLANGLGWDNFLSSIKDSDFDENGLRESYGISASTARKYMRLYLGSIKVIADDLCPKILMEELNHQLHSPRKSETLGKCIAMMSEPKGQVWIKKNRDAMTKDNITTFAMTYIGMTKEDKGKKKPAKELLVRSLRSIFLGRKSIQAAKQETVEKYEKGLRDMYATIEEILKDSSSKGIEGLADVSKQIAMSRVPVNPASNVPASQQVRKQA